MTRRSPAPAVPVAEEEDLQCLLCGAAVEPFWHPVLREAVHYDLCPRCAGVVQAAADRVAERIITAPVHNLEDAHCGHPDSVGVFPVPGAVCPLCRVRNTAPAVVAVPGQLQLDDAAEGPCPIHGWTHRFRTCQDAGQ